MLGVATSLPKAPTSENPMSSPMIRRIFGLVPPAAPLGADDVPVAGSPAQPTQTTATRNNVTITDLTVLSSKIATGTKAGAATIDDENRHILPHPAPRGHAETYGSPILRPE